MKSYLRQQIPVLRNRKFWKFNRGKYQCKSLFAISKHFMVEDAVNKSKDKACSAMESGQYHRDLPGFDYEIYTLIYEKNLRILSINEE